MARSRNIKPSIMDNEELAELPPLTRLLFVYLWMLADREGRLEDRPKRIAAQALAYDRSADVDAMLNELQASRFIERYAVDAVDCIQILAFVKHQNPHGTEKDSTLACKNGYLTVNPRGKSGCINGEPTLVKRDLTVKELLSNSAGNGSHNALIPDSLLLIPDSGFLKPDSNSVPNGTDGKPSKLTDPNEIIFGYGVPMLVNAGTAEKQARSFLGGLRKNHGDDALIDKLRECIKAKPLQPLEWLAAALPPGGAKPKVNKQEALEASNAAVAERFLRNNGYATQ